MTDRSQTKVRGYFVEFPDADGLREALKADGFVMGDRPLRVNVADERKSIDKGRRTSMDRGQRRNSHREDQWTSVGNAAPTANIVEPAAERPKLVLKPRSVEMDSGDPAIAVGSASIFGGAKPVDTSKILAEVEKKIDAELHREPTKLPTPKHEKKVHSTPALKIQEEVVTRVEDTNVFSLLSIEDDE
jgi:translation initiation factor 4B